MKYKRENEHQQWRHPLRQKEKTGRTELRPSFLFFSSRLLIAEKPKRTRHTHSYEVFEVTREYWKIEWGIFRFLSNIRAPSPVTWAHLLDPRTRVSVWQGQHHLYPCGRRTDAKQALQRIYLWFMPPTN